MSAQVVQDEHRRIHYLSVQVTVIHFTIGVVCGTRMIQQVWNNHEGHNAIGYSDW